MKKNFKNFLTILLFIVFSSSTYCNAAEFTSDASFSALLEEYNITIDGTNVDMTKSQISGFASMFNKKDINSKDTNYHMISSNNEIMQLSPEQILEFHYYSLSNDEQRNFIYQTANQKVHVSENNDIILISYNSNNIISSYQIKSSHTATVYGQDPNTGVWGSATANCTATFYRTIYEQYWEVGPLVSSISYTMSPGSPFYIITHLAEDSGPYSNTTMQPYYGNEVWDQTDSYFNLAILHIRIFPNSAYNYSYTN